MSDRRVSTSPADVRACERPSVERVFERMTEALWTVELTTGQVLYLNPAAERLYGRSQADFDRQQTHWFDWIHPQDRDRIRHSLAELDGAEDNTDLVWEYRILRADGEQRWVRSQVWHVAADNGVRIQGLTTDLTEYRHTQQQKLQFEKLAANVPGVIYQYIIAADGSYRFSYMSPGAKDLYELEAADIEADANLIWNLIHPEDFAEFEETVAESATNLRTWKHQWRNYTASGKLKWISGIAQPERRSNGDLVCDGILLDITEQKKAEAERDRFFDCALDLFCIVGFDGYFKRLNPAWESVLGYDLNELKTHPFLEFVHPEDVESTRAQATKISQGQNALWFENRYRTQDGNYRWLAWTTVAFPEEQMMYAIARDITESKLASLERDRLIAIIEASPDIISSSDLAGQITYFNPGGRKTLGLTPDEDVTQYHVNDFLPKEVSEKFAREAIPTTLERGMWQGTAALCDKDGRCFPTSQVILSHPPTPYSEGYLSTIIRDISDIQAIENQLREQEQFLRTIYDNQANAVFVVDVTEDGEFRFASWNSCAEQLTGLSSDSIRGKTPLELFGEEIGEAFLHHYHSCLAVGQTITYETSFPFQEGLNWFQVLLTPLYDENGCIQRLIGNSTDISDRKQAELALQASEAQYRTLAQQEKLINRLAQQIRQSLDLRTILETTVREIYLLLGVDRCYFLWYRQQDGQFEFEVGAEAKREELPRRLDADPNAMASLFWQVLQQQRFLRIDDVEQVRDEALRSYLEGVGDRALLLFPIETEDGNLGLLACTREDRPQAWCDRDVELLQIVCDRLAIAAQQAVLYQQSREAEQRATAKSTELENTLRQLQKTQAQLIQAEKMSSLGQLVAGVAHEINNPVSFVFGNLIHAKEYSRDLLELIALYRQSYPQPTAEISTCLEDIDLDYLIEDLPKLFASIETGAVRIQEIVRSLRTFSRLDESDIKTVDLHENIESTLTILASRLRATDTRAEIQVIRNYGDIPRVDCYAGQLNQVFMNLLANAIDAIEACQDRVGCLFLTTERIEENRVRITIVDNGMGMTASVRDRIFDPFYTTKPIGKGTGLGLSISYQIVVEHHHGSFSCYSTPGEGTEFAIEIPLRRLPQSNQSA